MPYLESGSKSLYDDCIDSVVLVLVENANPEHNSLSDVAGHLKTVISLLVDRSLKLRFAGLRYSIGAMISGALINIRSEFYDRVVSSLGDRVGGCCEVNDEVDAGVYHDPVCELAGKFAVTTDTSATADCAGHLNYIVTRLLIRYIAVCFGKVDTDTGYMVMDVLADVYSDFYSNVMRPYEDVKIKENGDVGYEDILPPEARKNG